MDDILKNVEIVPHFEVCNLGETYLLVFVVIQILLTVIFNKLNKSLT